MATNQGKGFAGLSDLVSDVANEVEAVSTPVVRPRMAVVGKIMRA